MPNIDYIHATVSSEVASTSTSYTEVVETSALTAGKTYYIICHALVEGSSAAHVFDFRLLDRTNSDAVLTDSTMSIEPESANKCTSYSFVGKITAGTDGGGIEFQQKAPATKTVRVQYASILLLELSNMRTSDYFFASDSPAATHTTSYADRASVTLTDGMVGDQWLVLGWVATDTKTLAVLSSATIAFTEGGSTVTGPSTQYEGADTSETINRCMSRPYTIGSSGTLNWKIQTLDSSGNVPPNDYAGSAVFGIKLNAFADFVGTYDATGLTSTSTSFVNLLTESYTPSQTGNNIVIASSVADFDAGRRVGSIRVQVDSSTTPNAQVDSEFSAHINDNTDEMAQPYVSVFSGTRGVAQTVNLDALKTDSANVGWQENALSIFSTELNYDAPAVLGRRLGGRGLYRRGSLRKNLKRLRR